MNLIGKHNTKTIILWVGIITAIILILGSFFQFSTLGILVDVEPTLVAIRLEELKGLFALVQETYEWLKL